MRIEVMHVAGPVPVKREATLDAAALPPAVRKSVERLLEQPQSAGDERFPDVGTCRVKVTHDDGSTRELRFSDAEATSEQASLLKALRPFLKVTPWR